MWHEIDLYFSIKYYLVLNISSEIFLQFLIYKIDQIFILNLIKGKHDGDVNKFFKNDRIIAIKFLRLEYIANRHSYVIAVVIMINSFGSTTSTTTEITANYLTSASTIFAFEWQDAKLLD